MLQVIYTLTGEKNPHPPILHSLLDSFCAKLMQQIHDIIWLGKLRRREHAEALSQIIASMTPASRAQFLLSPEVFDCVCALEKSTSEDHFKDLISAYNLSQTPPMGDHTESIAVSHYLPPTSVLDFSSAFCNRLEIGSMTFGSEADAFTIEEEALVRYKVSQALSRISRASPIFLDIVRLYGRRICLRKSRSLGAASEHVNSEIGAIRLLNAHGPGYSVAQIADDLLHESTHSFLSTFEYVNFPFILSGTVEDPNNRPMSPWSFRPIKVLPFIHAIFVYFGLVHLASALLQEDSLAPSLRPVVFKQRNDYLSGFLMPSDLAQLLRETQCVDPRALQMVEWMQSAILRNYNHLSKL